MRTLRDELAKEFAPEGVTSSIYYYFNNQWNVLDDPIAVSSADVASLERAKSESISYHAPSSRKAWFASADAGVTISLEFSTSPSANTRKKYRARLTEVIERASNAFKVNHHELTLLLAKGAFNAKLLAAVAKQDGEKPLSSDAQSAGDANVLCVFALDIDHFKQVNDSYGHAYGDLVLKIFAIRIEKASADWMSSEKVSAEISVGHPSGEEFLVLVHGAADRAQVMALADFLRNKIASDPLPSREDCQWLEERGELGSITLPPLHERKITASVGVAFDVPTGTDQSAADRVATMLEQADTALYRAKAAGRDRVIAFDEILSTCGRVLEQDVNSRIVAIDIGSNVGVSVGQEFFVYPPTFCGTKKFTVNDGRTSRTIGTYPRVDITRIVVFDVQPEISFAATSDQADSVLTIEAGSHLEAIPLGSIGHLLGRQFRFFPRRLEGARIGDIEAAQEFVAANSDPNSPPFVVIFRFMHATKFLKRFGPAALNNALARLFKDATASFHAAAVTGVVDSESVIVVGRRQAYDERAITAFVDRLGVEFAELGLVAGVFRKVVGIARGKDESLELDPKHAIDFARFAASDYASTAKSRVTIFDESVAHRILWSQREAKAFSQAWADFERMRELGIESAGIINQGGLIAARQRMRDQAADLFEQAASMSEEIVYKSNFATTAGTPERAERALRMLNGLPEQEVVALSQKHPYGFFSYAVLLAEARLGNLPGDDSARLRLVGPAALNLGNYKDEDRGRIIEEALRHV